MNKPYRTGHLILGFVGVFLLFACQTVPQPRWELPSGVKTLPANGYPLAYIERGTGPTVILVHGGPNDYRYWEPDVEALSSRFHVVAISLRHHYPERWDGKGEYSLKLHSEDLASFIERISRGPVYLVAHSRGGALAAGTARARPELIRKLVLMEPGIFSLAPTRKVGEDDPRVARAKAAAVYFDRKDVEAGLEFFTDDVNGAGAWRRLPEAERQIRRDNAWTIPGQKGDVDIVDCASLRDLKMPVLLMGGAKSTALFSGVLDAAEKCIPSAKRVVIANAGHTMNRMNPGSFRDELTKFLVD